MKETEANHKIEDSVKEELKEIVGEEDFLSSPEDLINYSYDAYYKEYRPEAVIFPSSTGEVTRIIKAAAREGIPLTPRGAGTNISGGSVPKKGGIIVSFTKMNRILDIDKVNRYAVVQPGVINAALQEAVAREGLFYPPDPGSLNVSTMGGNVAENAGGPRGVKYGVTKDYVIGLEVVLASGKVIRTGGKTLKNVTGFDLTSLFCGSEGTLGLITEIIVRLLPMPEAKRTLQAVFQDLDQAGRTVSMIIGSGILPVALELMDRVVVNHIEDARSIGLARDAEGILLIEVDGPESTVEEQLGRIADLCRAQGASDIRVASSTAESEALWEARRAAFGAMAQSSPTCIVEDVTVPVSELPKMVRKIVEISERKGIRIGVLAHAGDGNMHPLILTDLRDHEEFKRVEEAVEEIFQSAVQLGGTLSGEHGIGNAKEPFLPLVMSDECRQIMRQLKDAFDPGRILNPGSFV